MKKIVTLGIDVSADHKKRLESVGKLEIKKSPSSVEDFVSKAQGADVVYSNGAFLFDSLPKLEQFFF